MDEQLVIRDNPHLVLEIALQPSASALRPALWALARWGMPLEILLGLGFATGVKRDFPQRLILTWAVLMVPGQAAITVMLVADDRAC
jgi:hypothetical protein